MTLEAQVVGTHGRLEGDPQLIGARGRIPFAFGIPTNVGQEKARGDIVLVAVACAALLQASGVRGDVERLGRASGDAVLVASARADLEPIAPADAAQGDLTRDDVTVAGELGVDHDASADLLQVSSAESDVVQVSKASGDVVQVARARGDILLVDDATGDLENC